jgi:hypothetical protein
MVCEHKNFEATTTVNRFASEEGGPVVAHNAVITIHCRDCDKRFQFLGLPLNIPGLNTGVSPDGLTACIAICPEGDRPTPLAAAINGKTN